MAIEHLLDHRLGNIFFDKDTSCFEERWKQTTKNAEDSDLKNFHIAKLKVGEQCLPKYYLCDARLYLQKVSPELQIWIDEIVMEFWDKHGLEKVGFLISYEAAAQITIEDTMIENPHNYTIRYFENEDELKQWLFE